MVRSGGQEIDIYLFPHTGHGIFEFRNNPDGSRDGARRRCPITPLSVQIPCYRGNYRELVCFAKPDLRKQLQKNGRFSSKSTTSCSLENRESMFADQGNPGAKTGKRGQHVKILPRRR